MSPFRPRGALAPALLLVLAGCHRGPPRAPPLPPHLAKALGGRAEVNAAGEAPLWSAQVRPGRIHVSLDAGERSATLAAFSVSGEGATWTGATADKAALELTVEATPCHDAATGLPYPLSAKVQVGGRTEFGCAAPPGQGLGPRQ